MRFRRISFDNKNQTILLLFVSNKLINKEYLSSNVIPFNILGLISMVSWFNIDAFFIAGVTSI